MRLEQGLSQEDLGERAGMHYTYVSRIESGRGNVSVRKLLSLAEALDTTASDLLRDLHP